MFTVLNSTDYPIIIDGDQNAVTLDALNGFAANVTAVYSENRFGEAGYVGTVTERSAESRRLGMPRYAYSGYGFPDGVETGSAVSINMIVVLAVREWAEHQR